MKAFLLSIVVMLVVALSAAYIVDDYVARDADAEFVSDNVRL